MAQHNSSPASPPSARARNATVLPSLYHALGPRSVLPPPEIAAHTGYLVYAGNESNDILPQPHEGYTIHYHRRLPTPWLSAESCYPPTRNAIHMSQESSQQTSPSQQAHSSPSTMYDPVRDERPCSRGHSRHTTCGSCSPNSITSSVRARYPGEGRRAREYYAEHPTSGVCHERQPSLMHSLYQGPRVFEGNDQHGDHHRRLPPPTRRAAFRGGRREISAMASGDWRRDSVFDGEFKESCMLPPIRYWGSEVAGEPLPDASTDPAYVNHQTNDDGHARNSVHSDQPASDHRDTYLPSVLRSTTDEDGDYSMQSNTEAAVATRQGTPSQRLDRAFEHDSVRGAP